MRAAVLHRPHDLRIEDRPTPTPESLGPAECLVRVASVGVCGSDVHFYELGRLGRFVVEAPLILGHECSGTVVAVGSGVRKVRVGDRVAIEPGVPCGRCAQCYSGRYNLCPDVRFMAAPPDDGSLCEFVAHPEDLLFPLPPEVSLEQGALIEPLAVGVYAARRSRVGMGDTVLVVGCGTIGLLTLQAARAAGASRVLATDVQANRLGLARELGAVTCNAASEDVLAFVHRETAGRGADVVFECAGSPATTEAIFPLVRAGGTVCLVGLPPDPVVPWDLSNLVHREVTAVGVFRYANCFADSIQLVAAGQVELAPLVTARYSLEDSARAFEFASTKKDQCIKVVIHVSD